MLVHRTRERRVLSEGARSRRIIRRRAQAESTKSVAGAREQCLTEACQRRRTRDNPPKQGREGDASNADDGKGVRLELLIAPKVRKARPLLSLDGRRIEAEPSHKTRVSSDGWMIDCRERLVRRLKACRGTASPMVVDRKAGDEQSAGVQERGSDEVWKAARDWPRMAAKGQPDLT